MTFEEDLWPLREDEAPLFQYYLDVAAAAIAAAPLRSWGNGASLLNMAYTYPNPQDVQDLLHAAIARAENASLAAAGGGMGGAYAGLILRDPFGGAEPVTFESLLLANPYPGPLSDPLASYQIAVPAPKQLFEVGAGHLMITEFEQGQKTASRVLADPGRVLEKALLELMAEDSQAKDALLGLDATLNGLERIEVLALLGSLERSPDAPVSTYEPYARMAAAERVHAFQP